MRWPETVSRRFALFDVSIILAISIAYVTLEAVHVPKRWSFAMVGVALLAYTVYLTRRRTDSWRDLGFRVDNLRAAALPFGLITLLLGAGLVAWAALHGRPIISRQAVLLLALYPLWAIVQQLAFQGLLHRRLMLLVPSRALQIAVTAAAFAAVHVGNWTLVLLTFSVGIVWSMLYRAYPNLWLLGASHTVLAALAYPLVLGDAPLSRL